ncbi:S24 family peptidase [Pedobacter paludis]|uniref:Peptidase S24/S26A/S26B/S26C domain-containing protein n=1 Tax=Pedobacter paludis TaxID=2203212 RepID=A0A317EV33_9SPHI|nr:hypothetical protein [Pedobacter paludis]PWS30325.1 hypothetical protein DF947_18010 [Pedobacter paludis]
MFDALLASDKQLNKAIIARRMNKTPQVISNYLNPMRPVPEGFVSDFIDEFKLNRGFYETGNGDPVHRIDEPISQPEIRENAKAVSEIHYPLEGDDENPYIELGNGQYLMLIPLVNEYAYAGYMSGFADLEYIEELPKHTIIVGKKHSGKYLSFEAFGDSMFDGSNESIEDGSIVTGRDLPRHHWQNKFHINAYKYWVIVHKNGILIKQILKHDSENGIITCHSLNPDKEKFPDFTLHLDEVDQLFNIVNISKPIR